MKKLILIIIFSSYTFSANSQPTAEWEKRYSDPNGHNVYFVDMALDKEGDVFVTGYIYVDVNNRDMLTLKYDSQGNLKWTKTYDSPVHRYDIPNKIAVDNSGDVIIAGYSLKTSGLDDYFVIKYSSNGDSLWSSRMSYGYDTMSRASSVIVDDSDNVYVIGFFDRLLTGASMLVKYDKSGNKKWIKYYKLGDSTGYGAVDVVYSKNNFIYTLSVKYNVGDIVIKYDLNGNQIWQSGDTIGGIKMYLDNQDNVIVGGYFTNGTYNGADLGMVKYDSSGNMLWLKTYNSSYGENDIAYNVAIDFNGNSYITGVGGQVGQMGWDYTTIKYNTTGDSVWVKRYNPATASDDWAFSVAADKYGNAYVTGKSNNYNLGYGYTTIKYSPTGAQLWVKRYDGGFSYGNSEAKKIIVDTNLNIYVSGNSDISGITEIATVKYSQLTGIQTISNNVPDKFFLYQNYPNPFNPSTKIRYQIKSEAKSKKSEVRIIVYDILGKVINTLVDEDQSPGIYEVNFSSENISSGIYFYRLSVNGIIIDTKKLFLLK